MQQINQKDGGDGIKRPLDALLHASLHRRDALQTESLRDGLNQRGRPSWMTGFWIGLLRKAIAKLLGLDWEMVQTSVKTLMTSELSGEEKRRLVLLQLRTCGIETATWLLSAAIEVAYCEVKEAFSCEKE